MSAPLRFELRKLIVEATRAGPPSQWTDRIAQVYADLGGTKPEDINWHESATNAASAVVQYFESRSLLDADAVRAACARFAAEAARRPLVELAEKLIAENLFGMSMMLQVTEPGPVSQWVDRLADLYRLVDGKFTQNFHWGEDPGRTAFTLFGSLKARYPDDFNRRIVDGVRRFAAGERATP